MIKKLIYIGTFLLLALWAWPAQAGCNCASQPVYRTQYPTYQMQTYRSSNYDPVFGQWYGVNNTQQFDNPFSDWYGVNNTGSLDPNNPFADWYGVNNTGNTSNPFSDWYGVNNTGYTGAPVNASNQIVAHPTPVYQTAQANNNGQYIRPIVYANNNSTTPTSTYFVAPKTGVDKYAPFGFAGLLMAGMYLVRKRKWIFN